MSTAVENANSATSRLIPGGTARDVAFHRLPENPDELLHESLFPEDAYEGEVYWADLPAKARAKWINKQQGDEIKREFLIVWRMFKEDPLLPFWKYFKNFVVAGLGFLAEGYVLFSVGNIITLFEAVWPQCYQGYTVCSKTWVHTINYLEIVGIICGQIMIGIIGDFIGRRWGIIQDATTMFLAAVMLTAMWGTTLNGWVICYALSLLVFGIGVEGEYPMTSTTAMEGVHGHSSSRNDKLHRGRSVLLAFLMQGWGQLLNQGVLIILLLIFHGGGNPPYGKTSAQYTFRVSFAFAAFFLLLLMYIRIYKLRNVDQASKASKDRSKVTGYDTESLKLVTRHYWHRLFATSLSLLIDYKAYGRQKMQAVGFIMSFILFIIAAAVFPTLNQKGPGAHGFEFIYFFSSFWIQFGPNSTTFVVAGEVYPSPVRATAHGVSAAVGKLGALAATVLYNYIGARTKFWVVSWFALIGFILTIIFIPDTTGLDLREQERYWQYVREGRENDYHGIAIHPRHLSLFERLVLKRNKNYDPKLDKESKIKEMRQMYNAMNERSGKEDLGRPSGETLTEDASAYFEWEKSTKSVKSES